MGGIGFKPSVAVATIAYIWMHNVAFNIPLLVYTNVIVRSARTTCVPVNVDVSYILTTRVINFYLPLIVTWTSYIGIIVRLKHSANKAIL